MIDLIAIASDALRWQIVLAGTLFAISALACLLLRGRMAIAALLVLTIAAAACIIVWRSESS